MGKKLELDLRIGFLLLAALILGVWPARALLASSPLAEQVSGKVRLQGRLDSSGVDIQIQSQSGGGELQSFGVPLQTGTEGVFTTQAEGTLIITAHKQGYLDAQAKVDAASGDPMNLGPTILYGGEVTGDNVIDISDLAYLGAKFSTNDSQGDINGDGLVDILDLSMAAANFKMRGPTPWGE